MSEFRQSARNRLSAVNPGQFIRHAHQFLRIARHNHHSTRIAIPGEEGHPGAAEGTVDLNSFPMDAAKANTPAALARGGPSINLARRYVTPGDRLAEQAI
jgi:hypothetical protein